MKRATAERVETLSVEAWGDLDEDVEGEIVDGVLEEEEMPTFLHEIVVAWLVELFRVWARRRRAVVVGSEAKIAVGPRRGRKPDVAVFVDPHLPPVDATLIRVPPYLVIEVLSPRPRDQRRDRIDKLHDYARARVKYYWVVDPALRAVEVFELKGHRYVAAASTSARMKPPGFGRTIDFRALWAEVDAASAGARRR